MDFIANMSGPSFLVLYFFVLVFTLIFCSGLAKIHSAKKFAVLLGFGVINGLGGYKLIVALSHGRTNVGFLILFNILANLIMLGITFAKPRPHRRGMLADQRGGVFVGADSCGSSCSSSTSSSCSSSSSSCSSSSSSCSGGGGCGGCGGGGGGD